MSDRSAAEIASLLAAPFRPGEVEFKAQTVKGNRALAAAYVDARVVMDRLDEVLGLGNWQTEYRLAADGVVCRLSAFVAGRWIVHEDFGSLSDQPDKGDRFKAAFSDALKRVAVRLGVGRYLYSLPKTWADYDPQRKQFVRPPQIQGAPGERAAGAGRQQQQPAAPPGRYEPTEAEKKLLNVHAKAFEAATTPAKLETARQLVIKDENLSREAKALLKPHYDRANNRVNKADNRQPAGVG